MQITSESFPLIVIDERERGAVREIFGNYPCRTHIETLETGDYLVNSETAIERKRGDDLIASICDGRFFSQLRALLQKYAHPMLILENPQRMFLRRNFNDASIYGALLYASYKLKVPVIPTQNENETGLILWSLAKKLQKEKPYNYDPEKISRKPLSREDQIDFLEGLIAVGNKKANQLLNAFQTPAAILKNIGTTEFKYDSNGKPKGTMGPLAELNGFGIKFIKENQQLLQTPIEESKLKPFF
jgi:ERCC4-type nuclease